MTRRGPGSKLQILRLRGELDVPEAEPLRRVFAALLWRNCEVIAVDLSQVRFVCGRAAGALVTAERLARERGIRLVLVRPPSCVTLVLATMGVLGRFQVLEGDAGAAVAAVRCPGGSPTPIVGAAPESRTPLPRSA